MNIERIFSKYTTLVERFSGKIWICRCALVLAPIWTSISVFISGILCVVCALITTIFITRLDSVDTEGMWIYVVVLSCAFFGDAIGHWINTRQSMKLVLIVRQITYRRFSVLFQNSITKEEVRKSVLTYPNQISQFAYVIDLIISIGNLIAFIILTVKIYQFSGLLGVFLIFALLIFSVWLVRKIGVLWNEYINFESERRRKIQLASKTLPRGKFMYGWNKVVQSINEIRRKESFLLVKRVRLQILNGFVQRGALTTILSFLGIITVLLFPDLSLGIGIIFAAKNLFSSSQNLVANYRVIRLGIPMLQEIEKWEKEFQINNKDTDVVVPKLFSERLDELENKVNFQVMDTQTFNETSYLLTEKYILPQNPILNKKVVEQWKSLASDEDIKAVESLLSEFGLSIEVIQRLWISPETLSSGETHRAALAMLLIERPEIIILCNTFAAMDFATREQVANVLLNWVDSCVLISDSVEYIPTVFQKSLTNVSIKETGSLEENLPSMDIQKDTQIASQVNNGSVADKDDESDATDDSELKLITEKESNLIEVSKFLLGNSVFGILFGAVLLSVSEILLAQTISSNAINENYFMLVCACCIIAAISGTILFYTCVFYTPINRLSRFHKGIMSALPRYANKKNGGDITARLGEDFSELQMSIPGIIGTIIFIFVQLFILIVVTSIGNIFYLIILVLVMPFVVLSIRIGQKLLIPASTEAAAERGKYIDVLETQASQKQYPSSNLFKKAIRNGVYLAEKEYIDVSLKVVSAYSTRTALVESIIFILGAGSLIFGYLFGTSEFLTLGAIVYLAVMLSSQIYTVIDAVNESGLISLTYGRVMALKTYSANLERPKPSVSSLKRLEEAISENNSLIAIVGKSGAGKSLLIDDFCNRLGTNVVLFTDKQLFYFDDDSSDKIMLFDLLKESFAESSAHFIVLDETFKNLDNTAELEMIQKIRKSAIKHDKQVIVVLHSRSNLEQFDCVIEVSR